MNYEDDALEWNENTSFYLARAFLTVRLVSRSRCLALDGIACSASAEVCSC